MAISGGVQTGSGWSGGASGWTTTANVIRETGSTVLNVSSGGKVNKETLWQNEEL